MLQVNGENISIREAIKNAMRSEGFKEFMEMFSQFMTDWSEEGFEKAFPKFAEQLKERFDVDGEDHAYKVELPLNPALLLHGYQPSRTKRGRPDNNCCFLPPFSGAWP